MENGKPPRSWRANEAHRMARKAQAIQHTYAPLLRGFAVSECVEKGPGVEAINKGQGDFLGNVIALVETITKRRCDFPRNLPTAFDPINRTHPHQQF